MTLFFDVSTKAVELAYLVRLIDIVGNVVVMGCEIEVCSFVTTNLTRSQIEHCLMMVCEVYLMHRIMV